MKKHLGICMAMLLILSCLGACSSTTTIYLVRHAEKRNTSDTSSLTPPGSLRAQALRDSMQNKGIDSIYASIYLRTQLTAKPTAELSGITMSLYDPANSIALAQGLKSVKNKKILVAGHSDNIPVIIQEITGQQVSIPHDVFNKIFIIKISRASSTRITLTETNYGAPSP